MSVVSVARRALAETAKATLRALPLPVWKRLFPRDALLPMYHVVSDEKPPHLHHYPYKNRSQFEADVAYARENHGFIAYDELLASRLRGQDVAGNRFFFTFDDGLVECFTVIRPILKKHGATAAFFITTSLLDNQNLFFESALSLCIDQVGQLVDDEAERKCSLLALSADDSRTRVAAAHTVLRRGQLPPPRSDAHRLLILYLLGLNQRDEPQISEACGLLNVDADAYLRARQPYMTSGQLRQLAADGFIIGGHSVSHRRLQSLSNDELAREIVVSCDVVRQITGQKRVPFAFPYYGVGLDKELLGSVLSRHPEVEIYFDTGGFCKNVPYIVDRFWADLPGPPAADCNMHNLLLSGWSHPSAWQRNRATRVAPESPLGSTAGTS